MPNATLIATSIFVRCHFGLMLTSLNDKIKLNQTAMKSIKVYLQEMCTQFLQTLKQ